MCSSDLFARIVALLHVLVRKEQKWKWEKEQEEAFEKLKAGFTTEPVLAIPDIDKEIRVEADASDYATGGVLSTKYEDGKWRPVVMRASSRKKDVPHILNTQSKIPKHIME